VGVKRSKFGTCTADVNFIPMLKTLAFTALTISLSTSFLSGQNSLSNKKKLVVATYQYGDNDRLKNIKPFADHFADVAGVKTTVKSYPSAPHLLQAMNKGEVDIAFMSTFAYLILREQVSTFEISASLHLPDSTASHYTSVIVSPKSNNIKTLEDAISRASDNVLFFVAPASTSGNLVPRLKFASLTTEDPEMIFMEVRYAERHNLALENMLQEKFSLAAFGSDEYYKMGADTAKVNLLWESPPIPLGPVVCKKDLPENLKISLKKALLDLNQENIEALESIKAGWTEAKFADYFEAINDIYYDKVLNLCGNRERAMMIIKKFAR
jgi:phosphonate transport system substrate-binding protein